MNIWIRKSMELAKSEGYLDKLYEIYPAEIGDIRDIKEDLIREIKNAYNKKDELQVLKSLLKLPKFPIEHPYVSILRNHPYLIEKKQGSCIKNRQKIAIYGCLQYFCFSISTKISFKTVNP